MIQLKSERPFDYGTQKFFNIIEDGVVGQMNVLYYESGEVHIDRIDIDDEHQNKGFGTKALAEFSGAYIVADNEGAARLYQRLGSEVSVTDEFSTLDEGFGVYILD